MNQAFLIPWFALKKVTIHDIGVLDFRSRYFMASWTHFFLGSAQVSLAFLVLNLWRRREAIGRILFENCVHLTLQISGPSICHVVKGLLWDRRKGAEESWHSAGELTLLTAPSSRPCSWLGGNGMTWTNFQTGSLEWKCPAVEMHGFDERVRDSK